MKTKHFFLMSLLAVGMGITTVSCGSDDPVGSENNGGNGGSDSSNGGSDDGSNGDSTTGEVTTEEQAQDYDYNATDAAAWGSYAVNVSKLLQRDANTLYTEWNNSYAQGFKNADKQVTGFESHQSCVQQIIEGCWDIANEVGSSKIGDPYNKYKDGKTREALYAVESWYSYHSREDYMNNILSIAYSLAGTRFTDVNINNFDPATSAAANSIYKVAISKATLKSQIEDVWAKTKSAYNAIYNIPDPFRNNIGDAKVSDAMEACDELQDALNNIKVKLVESLTDAEAQAIVNTYVDDVVMPTYNELVSETQKLTEAVTAFQQNPNKTTCKNACDQWIEARRPWETSEAFLFGPVAEKGLDPNMDSWPLDAIGIVNLLKTQQWSQMEWSGKYDEENEAIEAAQSVSGFHTLEYLLFKNGKPRIQ